MTGTPEWVRDLGAQAHAAGRTLEDNPYVGRDRQMARDWRDGWQDAQSLTRATRHYQAEAVKLALEQFEALLDRYTEAQWAYCESTTEDDDNQANYQECERTGAALREWVKANIRQPEEAPK